MGADVLQKHIFLALDHLINSKTYDITMYMVHCARLISQGYICDPINAQSKPFTIAFVNMDSEALITLNLY